MVSVLFGLFLASFVSCFAAEIRWPPTSKPGPKINNGEFITLQDETFIIKDTKGGLWGPGNNVFVGNEDFVWKDNWGLHLNIRPQDGCRNWASSEVFANKSYGYGNYVFRIVGPLETQDWQTTLGAFTWEDDCAGDCFNREMDIEWGRWGNPDEPNNGQFVVQPHSIPGNLKRFPMTKARSYGGELGPTGGGECNSDSQTGFNGAKWNKVTAVLQWFPGLIRWYVFDGLWPIADLRRHGGNLLASWGYRHTRSVFRPGGERFHFNLWQANDGTPAYGRRVHFIIHSFEHNSRFIDFAAAGINTDRIQLGSGKIVEDVNYDFFDEALNDLDLELSDSDKKLLVDLIKKQAYAVAERDGTPPDWNITEIHDWLNELTQIGHSKTAKHLSLTDTVIKQLGDAREKIREALHIKSKTNIIGRRRMQKVDKTLESRRSFSSGDARGSNLLDFASVAESRRAQAVTNGQPSASGVPAWAAGVEKTGYYGPNGFVPPVGSSSGGSASTGTSKGAVIGLSIGGGLVGLISLFTAGVLLRRHLKKREELNRDVMLVPERVMSKRGTDLQTVPPALQASYRRFQDLAHADETELNPLAASAVDGDTKLLSEENEDEVEVDKRGKARVVPT